MINRRDTVRVEEGCPIYPRESFMVIRGVVQVSKLELNRDEMHPLGEAVFYAASDFDDLKIGDKLLLSPFLRSQVTGFQVKDMIAKTPKSYASLREYYEGLTPEERKNVPDRLDVVEYFVVPADQISAIIK